MLALNTLLANGLQLYGARWTRRGRTSRRVYLAATLARGTWVLAGVVPAALALRGHTGVALLIFILAMAVSAVAAAAASPAMAARAATVTDEQGRTRYLADRMTATWLGALLGTAGMTWLVTVRPGPAGYALGFAIAGLVGLAGLGIYAALLRAAAGERSATTPRPAAAEELAPNTSRLAPTGNSRTPAGLSASDAAAASTPTAAGTAPVPGMLPAPGTPAPALTPATLAVPMTIMPPSGHWWYRVARRLGAPDLPALGNLVLAAAILQGGASMIGPAAPIWLVHHLGAPSSFIGVVSLVSSLAAIASQRLWARWIDRAGADRVIAIAGAAAALIPAGWLLVWQLWVALPVSAYGGLAWGGYNLAMTSRLLQLAPPADRAAYLGTYAAAVGAAGAIGSLLAGAVTAAVPPVWIPAVFALSLLTRVLGWRALSRARA